MTNHRRIHLAGRVSLLLLVCAAPVVVSLAVSRGFVDSTGIVAAHDQYAEGRKLFNRRCRDCHTVQQHAPARVGPALHDIGKKGAERKPGMSAAEYILESILDPAAYRATDAVGGMPYGTMAGRDDEDVRELVGFLASRGATVEPATIRALSITRKKSSLEPVPKTRLHTVQAGKRLFLGKGKCVTCHLLRPDPGYTLRGPSLLHVASLSSDYLRQSIAEPNAKIAIGYQSVVVRLADGRTVTGRFLGETNQGVQVLEELANGDLRSTFVPTELMASAENDHAAVHFPDTSSMPASTGVLNNEEIEAIADFLKNLEGGRMVMPGDEAD